MEKVKELLENKSISRRSFLKGTAALGAMAAVYGCSREEDAIYSAGDNMGAGDDEYFTTTPVYRYGTSTHNCGGRCIIRAQVVDGNRIVRFLTDETTHAYDGSLIDNDGANTTQARACSRCRGYKGRLYHPGRLKYPLKQTKERGDITGFQRISWEQAISDISARLKAVQGKYGAEAFHSIYACGNIASQFQGGGYTGLFASADGITPALCMLGGSSAYTSDYSFHQGSYMGGYGTAYSGMINMAAAPLFYESEGEKHFVMWGSNIPTTHNPKAFSWTKAIEGIKENGGSIKFIGPELSEIGVAQADVWYQTRPYTDVALILGMLYHMITLTFNEDGTPTGNGLDVDYLDQMVYGFFETPAYWRNLIQYTDGSDTHIGEKPNDKFATISTIKPTDIDSWIEETGTWYIGSDGSVQTSSRNEPDKEPVDKDEYKVTRRWKKGSQYTYNHEPYVYVAAVPAGQSFSAYIMGEDARLTKALYGDTSYMASQFKGKKRNTSVANYTLNTSNGGNAASKYEYKKAINVAKTPEWASKITGIDENDIKELAEFYLRCGNARIPVYNEWAGGQLKQNDGTVTLYALQALLISTKNWGYTGTGIANNSIGVTKSTDPNQISNGDLKPAGWGKYSMSRHPQISVTQWHNAIKMAFAEQLKANGYEPNIPDWTKNTMGLGQWQGKKGEVYFDDGGVKSLVSRLGITGVIDKTNIQYEPKTFTVTERVNVPGKGEQDVTCTYYEFEGNAVKSGGNLVDQTANVKFTGNRFIINSAGNIPINQHANPIDSARMYRALPTYGYGNHQVAMEEAFYLVTFDNFMSPSARYSDYVLPAQTTWEQADFVSIENSGTLYVDAVKPGPGESLSTWEFMRDLIGTHNPAALDDFTGGSKNGKPSNKVRFDDVVRDAFENTISKKAESPYFGKTWEQFLEKPISHAIPSTTIPESQTNSIRAAYEAWAADDKTKAEPFFPGVTTVDWSLDSGVYGFCGDEFAETESCPKQTGMFQVYSGTLVWRYENLYSKWHGYLPKANQGQKNTDEEGDPIAWPIPVYFDYQDHFVHAYGLLSSADLAGRYLLTTTHDRFRAHSSQAENPYLRELTHRVKGGALYSGNDYGHYAVAKTEDNIDFYPLNSLINDNGLPAAGYEDRASYTDLWVNSSDFAGYEDGDLVKVSNEIGAVICTIRKTDRCVPGYVGLHQGCWVDLRGDLNNTASLIDVGGNCNTLMPSTPSRLDHGNGVQSAMVKIERYNG